MPVAGLGPLRVVRRGSDGPHSDSVTAGNTGSRQSSGFNPVMPLKELAARLDGVNTGERASEQGEVESTLPAWMDVTYFRQQTETGSDPSQAMSTYGPAELSLTEETGPFICPQQTVEPEMETPFVDPMTITQDFAMLAQVAPSPQPAESPMPATTLDNDEIETEPSCAVSTRPGEVAFYDGQLKSDQLDLREFDISQASFRNNLILIRTDESDQPITIRFRHMRSAFFANGIKVDL